jgi:hypothetical protein
MPTSMSSFLPFLSAGCNLVHRFPVPNSRVFYADKPDAFSNLCALVCSERGGDGVTLLVAAGLSALLMLFV